MRCLYCGRELALLKRLAGNGAFCSEGHREDYRKKFDQLALGRLRPDLPLQASSNIVIDLGALAAGGFESRPESQPRPWTQSMPVPFAAEPPRAAVDLAPPAESGFRFAPVMRDFTESKPASQRRAQPVAQESGWKTEARVAEAPRYEAPRQQPRAAWTEPPTKSSRLAPVVVDLSFLGEEEVVEQPVAQARTEEAPVAATAPPVNTVVELVVEAPKPIEKPVLVEVPQVAEPIAAPVAIQTVAEPAVVSSAVVANEPAVAATPTAPAPSPNDEHYWDSFDFASVKASVTALAAAVEPTPAVSAKPLAEPTPAATPFNEFAEFIEDPKPSADQSAAVTGGDESSHATEPEPPAEATFMPLTLHGLAPADARPMSFNRPVRVEVELRLPRWDSKPMLPGGKRAATVQTRSEAQADFAAKSKAPAPPREPLDAPMELHAGNAPQQAPAFPAAPISVFREPLDVPQRRPPVVKVAEESKPSLPEARLPEPIAAPYTDVEMPIPSAPAEAGRAKSAAKRSNKRVMIMAGMAAVVVMGWLLIGKGLFVHSAGAVAPKTPPGFTVDAASTRWVHDWAPAGPDAPVRYVSIVKDAADLKDFTVDFTGKIQNQAIGWVFRAKDPKNFYVEKLELLKTSGVPSASLTYFAVINGAEQRPAQLALLQDLPEDGVYKIHFEAVGSRFATSINGQEAGDFTDEHLDRGSIGLYSAGDEASELQGGFQVTLATGAKPAQASENKSDAPKPPDGKQAAPAKADAKPNDTKQPEPQKGN